MDHLAIVYGRAGCVVSLDCRDEKVCSVDGSSDAHISTDATFVLLDTQVKHDLENSPYTDRRLACERCAKELQVASLRDVADLGVTKALELIDKIEKEVGQSTANRGRQGIARVSKSFNGTGTASARRLHGVGTSANSQSDCHWQRSRHGLRRALRTSTMTAMDLELGVFTRRQVDDHMFVLKEIETRRSQIKFLDFCNVQVLGPLRQNIKELEENVERAIREQCDFFDSPMSDVNWESDYKYKKDVLSSFEKHYEAAKKDLDLKSKRYKDWSVDMKSGAIEEEIRDYRAIGIVIDKLEPDKVDIEEEVKTLNPELLKNERACAIKHTFHIRHIGHVPIVERLVERACAIKHILGVLRPGLFCQVPGPIWRRTRRSLKY